MRRILLSCIGLVLLIPQLRGNSTYVARRGQPFFQLQYHNGVHWNRSAYLKNEDYHRYQSFEARVGFQTTGGQHWHSLNRYPRYGLGFHYADQVIGRKDSILSNPSSVFAFYEAPIVRFGIFRLYANFSVGLSYTRLIYDPVSNASNDLVASHINLFFNPNVNLGVQLSEHLDMNLGYGFGHYSNGNIEEPQKGLNNWGWNMGMSYFFGGGEKPFRRQETVKKEWEEFKMFEELQFMLSLGYAEKQGTNEPTGEKYFTSSFTVDYAVHIGYRSAFTAGLDLFYDQSMKTAIKGVSPDEVTTGQLFYVGGHIGYQHTINRLTLLVNLGTYFHQHSYKNEFFFSRAGGRIRLTDHLSAHICIKGRNGIRSDWIEWGLAYKVKVR